MNIDQPEIDPLEAFLGQETHANTNEKLRLVIQHKTLGVMRRRRLRRRRFHYTEYFFGYGLVQRQSGERRPQTPARGDPEVRCDKHLRFGPAYGPRPHDGACGADPRA